MGSLSNFANSLLDASSTATKTYDEYITKQANLSTQTKNIQLQSDIDAQLARIRQSSPSDFNDWNTEINNFFEQVRSGMGDKNSPYYCKNNLQAEQFTKILDQNQVSVSDQVNRLVEQQQIQKNRIDVNKSLLNLQNMGLTGQEYYDEAKKVVDSAYAVGSYSQQEYEQLLDNNFFTGYSSMYENMFNDTVMQSIQQGDSFETIWSMMEAQAPNMMKTDGDNMPANFDKKSYDATIKKTLQQSYNAKLADVQNTNAGKLSEIVQQMRQQTTEEAKLSVARKGFNTMNQMQGIQLSTSQRDHYSDIFEFVIKSSGSTGGSGGGLKASDFDSFENLLKHEPETLVQLIKDGVAGNAYEAAKMGATSLLNELFTGNYKENYDKDYEEREELYSLVYKGVISEDALSTKLFDLLVDNYPTAKDLIKNDYNKLITDIQKNHDKYGTASVGALGEWMMDYILGADQYTTDDDFVNAFKQHINDCYAESIDYVTLDKKGNLKKTFNAKSEKGIAEAARFAQSHDFVYTWQGQERWGEGKKEALEAEGGVVNTLKNAVAGTLGLTEADIKASPLGFYYKPDEAHDDLTSVPIITYKGKGYEVIPNDDDKGFKVRVIEPGKEDTYLDGKVATKELQLQRADEKKDAKQVVKTAKQQEEELVQERHDKTNQLIRDTNTITKAMKAAKTVSDEDWKNASEDVSKRQIYLSDTENKIDAEARKIKKKEAEKNEKKKAKMKAMTRGEFYTTYGITYDSWIKSSQIDYRYELILNSK